MECTIISNGGSDVDYDESSDDYKNCTENNDGIDVDNGLLKDNTAIQIVTTFFFCNHFSSSSLLLFSCFHLHHHHGYHLHHHHGGYHLLHLLFLFSSRLQVRSSFSCSCFMIFIILNFVLSFPSELFLFFFIGSCNCSRS